MIFKVFDVSRGSSSLLISPTGKRELVDFGSSRSWSPIKHVFSNLLGADGSLHRLVLTHHHGDHLSDLRNMGSHRPCMVVRRKLEGRYKKATEASNSSESQGLARDFASIFDSWTGKPSPDEASDEAWGLRVSSYMLTVEEAESVSSSDNSVVNNCSVVRIYSALGSKVLLLGDLEKEGISKLLCSRSALAENVEGTSVLLAPHHGHRSAFSTELFDAMGKPLVVLSSTMSGDQYVDSRYSSDDFVRGIGDGSGGTLRLLTTRSHGAMSVRFASEGGFQVDTHTRD